MVVEDAGHRTGERVAVDRPVDVADLEQDLVEAVDDAGEQLTGDLASSIHRAENLLGLTVQSSAQLGHLIPGAGPVVRGDGRDAGFPYRPDQVAPVD